LSELPSAEQSLMIEMLLFPVGSFSLRGAGRMLGKLSTGSRSYLQRTIQELQRL
jgi:hypothetical protein